MAGTDFFTYSDLARRTLARAENVNTIVAAIQAGFAKVAMPDRFKQRNLSYVADSGAADAYVVTFGDPAPTAYAAGMVVQFIAGATNTGAATLNVNSLGAKQIVDTDGNALAAGALSASAVNTVIYDGTKFRLQVAITTTTPADGTVTTAKLATGAVTTAKIAAGAVTASEIGDAELAAIAGLTSAADKLPYFTGSGTADLLSFHDEDDMASDDASGVASQQSIGQYIRDLSHGAICQGRLTLTSGTAVTTSAVTAAGTVYFTPFRGNRVVLYDGSNWQIHTLSELSLALSGLTASKPADIFLDYNGGTPQLVGTSWTDDTNRATALTTQDGAYVQTGNTDWLYLGTIYVDGSNQCADAEGKRHVWNMYNRVPRKVLVPAPTTTWTYATATLRYWNNDSGFIFDFVRGLNEDAMQIHLKAVFSNSVKGYAGEIAFDLDAGTAADADSSYGAGFAYDADYRVELNAEYTGLPSAGRHFLAGLEYGGGGGTQTWQGTTYNTGMRGLFLA